MCKYCDAIHDKYFDNPEEGAMRVWWIPQIPGECFYYPASTVEKAEDMLDILAQYDLFQWKHHIKPDYANAGGLEVFDGGEWIEWSDDDGNSIDDLMREKEEY